MAKQACGKDILKAVQECGVDAFWKGWYTEVGAGDGEVATSLLIKEILHYEKTKYQTVLFFDSYSFGRVLILDNFIQLTEKDECAYQEMLSFLPLNSHPNPKKVLVVGGGDGGVVREVVKHPLVETVILCEIDERVIELSKEYLPFMAKSFKSPKLTIHVEDGSEYMKRHKGEFDVIITDAPDPTGAGECLFQKSYYESVREALKPGGVVSSQGESPWIDVDITRDFVKMAKTVFPVVDYAMSCIASYPGGSIGYLLCSNSQNTNFRNPMYKFSPKEMKELELKFYTPEMHRASLALPFFLAEDMKLKWEVS